MVSGHREMEKVDYLEYSYLESEDKDAWKQYLKKGHIKLAMENCTKA
jgi:phosphopantetheine adenylyltransferase